MNTTFTKSILLAVLCTFLSNVDAATITWVGNTSNDWNTGSNWSSGSVPTSSDAVVISNASASNQPALDANRTIVTLDLSAGTLDLRGFTLNLTSCSFTGGSLNNGYIIANDFSAMQNTTFNGLVVLTKNGGSDNDLNGGNTFNGPVAIVNNDDSRLRMAVSNPDKFNGIIHFEENSSGQMEPAYNGINTFAGDISAVGSLNTVTFASGNGQVMITGTTSTYGNPQFNRLTINTNGQMSLLNTLNISALRIYKGTLDLENNSITTATAIFSGGTLTDGTVNFTNLDSMSASTFSGPLTLNKTGGANNSVFGGNTFNNNVIIINSSSSLLRLASTTGDDYNGNVDFRENSTGNLEPAYNGNNTFAANIATNNSSSVITFGAGSGFVIIDGNAFQSFVGNSALTPTVRRLTLNTSGVLYLDLTAVNIQVSLSFTSGHIQSSNNNEVIFLDGAIWTGAKHSSHVDGPVIKIGNDNFIFPVGDGSVYAPIEISAPSNTSDAFEATYINAPYSNTSSLASGLNNVSTDEHWILDRIAGSSSVLVTLHWNKFRHGGINSLTDMKVARWTGSQWADHGNGGTTGTETEGTVVSSAAITDFSPFTLGSGTSLNPLPISLLSFDAMPLKSVVQLKWATSNEIDNKAFIVEKSLNGNEWSEVSKVEGAGNSNDINHYMALDLNPVIGMQFYRLISIDLDGTRHYSEIRAVRYNDNNNSMVSVFPNPAANNINVNIPTNDNQDASIRISNSLGQVVFEMTGVASGSLSLDLTDFSAGIYQMQIVYDGQVQLVQLIKQ